MNVKFTHQNLRKMSPLPLIATWLALIAAGWVAAYLIFRAASFLLGLVSH